MSDKSQAESATPEQFIIKGGRVITGTRVPSLKFVRVKDLSGTVYEADLHVAAEGTPSAPETDSCENTPSPDE